MSLKTTIVPNADAPCDNCGFEITVNVVNTITEQVELETRLCGACCWGEADLQDPDSW